MIYYLKKYWKYLLSLILVLFLFAIIGYFKEKNDEISTKSIKKLSNVSKKTNNLKTLFVDVKGAVNAPGVYELEDGKRVIDAINLAGGFSDKADTINVNLSKRLTDEMFIVIYTKQEIYNYKKSKETSNINCASFECVCPDVKNDACIEKNLKAENNKKEANNKVSINNATKEDLMSLTGIGESKANAIINYRNENGLFKQIEDIKNVSGIGDSVFEKIKNNITL